MKEACVWAVDIEKLYGFFFPEDCPRLLTFRGQEPNYVEKGYAIAYIKKDWEQVLKSTHLSIYELDDKNFDPFDKIAGYYVSKQTEVPIARYRIEDCIKALDVYDVDLRVVDDLESYRQEIMAKTNNFSFRKLK